MSIRTRIFGPGADDPLLSSKKSRGALQDTLDGVLVRRSECRRTNARTSDRHRLSSEQAILRYDGQANVIELVNLSAGGAMIRGNLELQLWNQVVLVLGDGGEMDCAVRWIKDDSIGLEFAHETRIDCDKEARDEILRAVIRKSFPHVAEIELEYPKRRTDDDPTCESASAQRRQSDRHPLIWNGTVYYDGNVDYQAEPVRLRNISITGALVQSLNPLAEGGLVDLDLRTAGRHAATVKWTRGNQSGLEFYELFDIHSLSDACPEITPVSGPAEFFGNQEPWAPEWRRATLEQMTRSLSG